MEVIKISDKRQSFNGVSYYLCGNYFQKKGVRLHRAVWEYHNNKSVPHGYHVHHIDGDRANNDIENLSLELGIEHIKEHMKEPERVENGKRAIKFAQEKAPEWHRSAEGKAWHSQHAKDTAAKMTDKDYSCSYCGQAFKSKYTYPADKNRFCSNNCKAAFRRRRLRDNAN